MPVRTEWLIQDHVIYSQGIGDMTKEDIVQFATDIKTLLDQGKEGQPVHLIQDTRFVGKPYAEFAALTDLLGVARRFKGWYLIISQPGNRFFNFISTVAAQMLGIKMRPPFETYAAMSRFLMEQDPQLELPAEAPLLFAAEEMASVEPQRG